METTYHIPVLLQQSIEGLALKPGGVYVDATFGGGGHSREILRRLSNGLLIAFDQDSDAMAQLPDDNRLIFVNHNFRFLKNFLTYYKQPQVDGIMADLGISSHQIDTPEKGFSHRFEGELDMRMNTRGKQSVKDIVNQYDAEELTRIFEEFGELNNAHRLAGSIEKARKTAPIETTSQLKKIVRHIIPRQLEQKFLSKIFQALRIEVNQELDTLKQFLLQCSQCLKPGGRLVVITYHSLEDRIVKNFMKSGNFEGEQHADLYGNVERDFVIVNRKVIVPEETEIKRNNRARSAKLRIAEKQ